MIINTLKQNGRSFYFAHRGAPWVEKENSIMSFCKAIELGCKGLEADVQITKDKKLIIYHDMYIEKENQTFYINELTYFQISQIMQDLNEKTPPLFSELLPIIKQNKNVIFNIEIKSNKFNNYLIIKKIKEDIHKNNIINQCIISSFNYTLLLQIKLFFRHVLIGLLVGQERLRNNKMIINKIMIKVLRPTFINPNGEFISKQFINWLNQNKILIMAYTVNTKTLKNKLKRMGVTIFFTDNHSFYSNKSANEQTTGQSRTDNLLCD